MSGSFIEVTGNLTRDPELTHVGAANSSKLRFGVAFTHSWRAQDEWQEETSFVNVIAWRDLADYGREVLTKGMPVVVTGRLSIRKYDKDDGTSAEATEIVADTIAVNVRGVNAVTRRPSKSNGGGSQSTPTASSDDELDWDNL